MSAPPSPSAPSRLRGLAANLALSLTTVVVVLALLEGTCRLFDHEPAPRPVASYITVWNDGEFYTVKSAATGWPPWEDYNRDGLRDREHAVEKRAGVRRVMVLGDSVTLGFGLRPEQAYPQVLQDLLDARGEEAEVFNVALSGWSTRQERIAYERIGRKYRPDAVVVAVCLNDIPEIHNNLSRPPRLVQALYARSALVRRLVGARRREIHDVEELFAAPDSPSVREALARFFDELRRLRAEVERDGARLGVAVLPFRLQLEAKAPAPTVQDRISAFCAAERLPFLDLLPVLRPLGEGAFLDYDHLGAAGARRVAEAIADSPLMGATRDEGRGPAPRAASVPAAEGDRAAPWIERLRDPDPATRTAAARALGNLGADAGTAVPALARALRDAEPSVRAGAAWALGGFGPAAAAALGELTATLADEHPPARAGAAHALGAIGPAARSASPALVPRLADPAEEVRWRAEDALARLGPEPSSLAALLRILADPASPGRAGAAAISGRLGPTARAAVPALVAALADARGEVRGKAAWALGEIGPEASAAVPALIALVRDPDVGWHAIDALGAVGPAAVAAVPSLRSALADPSGNVRWRAALALGHMGPGAAAAAPELAMALRDPVDNVRLAAVHAVARIAPDAALAGPALAEALRKDADSRVRASAAIALGRLAGGGESARDALIGGTRDPDALVRSSAVHALARWPPSAAAAAALAQALEDPDPGVRSEAAKATRPRHR